VPSLIDGGKIRPLLTHDAAQSGLREGLYCRSAQTIIEDETFAEGQDHLALHA